MAREVQDRIALRLEGDTAKSQGRRLNRREKKLAESILYDNNVDDTFRQALVASNSDNADGSVYTGATGEIVALDSGLAKYEVYQAAVAIPGVVVPYQSADGLELKPVAAADALELTLGTTSLSRAAYTVGSLPADSSGSSGSIFLEAKIKIDDISDVTEVFFGWRKAEAYQADPDNYDEMASFNIGKDADGQIEIHTILNGAITSETDTTLPDWADGGEHTLRIEVSNSGVCTFYYDGATPTVTKSFQFDSGEVIVPFLHLNTEIGDPGLSISELKCGVK